MSNYQIKVLIYQTNPHQNEFFHVVEKTVWNFANGGTWSDVDGCNILRMNGSGTSGALRLLSKNGEGCIITLGKDHPNMEKQRERQLTSYETTDLQPQDLTVRVVIAKW
ncbi:Cytolysin/lectin [Lactarius indigo]|nr:Cytolysin/lectin [Lactarius indigo]